MSWGLIKLKLLDAVVLQLLCCFSPKLSVYDVCLKYLIAGTSKTWWHLQVSLLERTPLVTYLVDGEISLHKLQLLPSASHQTTIAYDLFLLYLGSYPWQIMPNFSFLLLFTVSFFSLSYNRIWIFIY